MDERSGEKTSVILREAFCMNYIVSVPALDSLETPVMICNSKGVVIYKNPSAMRTIRLPRRNTSIRSHLGQAEIAEMERIGERKKPSVLTLHTGDRPVRALVSPYVRDENSGAVLSASGAEIGEVCSLWVFPAVLQIYVSSSSGQYIETAVTGIAPELCKLVKEADRLSGLLPGKKQREVQDKMMHRIGRILGSYENLPEGRWFDLPTAIGLLLPIARRRLELLGARLDYSIGKLPDDMGLAMDLPRAALQLIYLLIYCVTLSSGKTVELEIQAEGEQLELTASCTLRWPPFTVEKTSDLSRLCLLLPGCQIDLLMLGSICKKIGRGVRWSLTDEAENNLHIYVDLPVVPIAQARTVLYSPTDLLFLERDMEAIFGTVWEERLTRYGEDEEA